MHPSSERLDAFGRGDVPEPEASTIEDHLAACPDCLEALAGGSVDDALIALVRAAGRTTFAIGPGMAEARPVVPPDVPTGYEILEPIGRGGMGVVYKANQRALGRTVALKQIQAGLDADEQELARFRIEAEAAARLRHPNIVQVYDIGVRDGLPFFAMELVEGGSLAARLRKGPLRPREAAELVGPIALALHHAHRDGVVHRDIKPGNILLTPDGTPKVADFGLAKRLGAEAGQTRTGTLLGTPSYMAPEQAEGRAVGPAADVYALGAVLYECLTGRPPFRAATPLETLEQVRSCDPPSPRGLQPGVPRDVQTICLKCLEKTPRRRYATAAGLADDLGRFLRGEPIAARPTGPAGRGLKWARRRPSQAALAGLGLATAIGTLAGLLAHEARLRVEVDRANRAAEDARDQRARAFANYQEAREAIQQILRQLDGPKYGGTALGTELRMSQIETALTFYNRMLGAADSPDPVVRYDTAIALRQAAILQLDLGRHEPAERNLERSIAMLDALAAERGEGAGWLRERTTTWVALGSAILDRNPARSIQPLETARAIADRLVRAEGGSAPSRGDLAWCEAKLGWALLQANRRGDAVSHYRRAADLRRALSDEEPADVRLRIDLAETLLNLGLIRVRDRPDLAEADFAEAVGSLIEAHEADPDELAYVEALPDLFRTWGRCAARRGRPDLALDRYSRGLTLVEPYLRHRAAVRLRLAARSLLGERADILVELGREAEAGADRDLVTALDQIRFDRVDDRRPHLLAQLQAGDHARAIVEIDELARASPGGSPLGGAEVYAIAGLYALASSAIGRDEDLSPERRAELGSSCARRALDALRRCAEEGFLRDPANRDRALRDPDLESIRDRPEFDQILDHDPSQAPPRSPRPPR
jgi:eukaryotic-like serine/threonine-protein kinase